MGCYINFKGKYLLTNDSFREFKKGLRFYRPASFVSFFKKNLTFFLYPFLKFSKNKIQKEEFFKRNKIEELLELEKNFGTFNAIYVPPGGGKFVIQVLEGSKISGYLKVAFTDKSIKNLTNEEETVNFLEAQGIKSFYYPKILYSNMINEKKLFYLSTPNFLKCPFTYNFRDILQLWKDIFTVESRTYVFEDIPALKELEYKINGNDSFLEFQYIFAKIKQDLRGVEIQTGLVHGDFKIWNIFKLKNGKFYVIDWEWAQRGSFPLWDLWTWAFSKHFLPVNTFNKTKMLQKVKEMCTISGFTFNEAVIKNLFNLYIIRLYITLEEYGHKDNLTAKTKQKLRKLLFES